MKTTRLIPFLIIPLLFACAPKKPGITVTEVPAEPLVQALELRRQSFSTLKGLAHIEARRKDRKRSFDTVGILIQGEERFKIEAYGPLGQSVLTLFWDGKEMLIDMSGQTRVMPLKNSGLERILGAAVEPVELAAILAGNIPWSPRDAHARSYCAPNGRCYLELSRGETILRAYPETGAEPVFSSYEVYSNGRLVYNVRFEFFEEQSGYTLPRKITVENPAKRVSLRVEYTDVDLGRALGADAFSMPGTEGVDR